MKNPLEKPTHDQISLAAYFIWEKEGRPAGREREHWLKAEEFLALGRSRAPDAALADDLGNSLDRRTRRLGLVQILN